MGRKRNDKMKENEKVGGVRLELLLKREKRKRIKGIERIASGN